MAETNTSAQITLELVDKLTKGLAEVNDKLDAIGTHSKNAEAQSRSLGDTLKNLAKIAGLGFIAKQIFDIGKSALQTAADFEQYNVSFKTMLGSAGEATKLLNQIKSFAATTPFELTELVSSSKQLLAFKVAAEDIIPTMTTLGNIAAGVGVPVGRLAVIFGQVKLAGRLMGQDLLQFTNAGVPLISELAKNFNTTESAIKKMVEQGKIGFKDVKKALENLGGPTGTWGKLMIEQSKTLSGVFSNIKDNITQTGLEVGNAMLPIAKVIAISFLGALDKVRTWFQDNQEGIKNFFLNLAAVVITLGRAVMETGSFLWNWIIKPMIDFVKNPIVSTILAIVAGYYAWTAATWALFAANAALQSVNPLAWVVVGVVAVIAAFNAITKHWDKVVDFVVGGVKAIWEGFKYFIDLIIKLFTGNLMGAINKVVGTIKGLFRKEKDSLQGETKDVMTSNVQDRKPEAKRIDSGNGESKVVSYTTLLTKIVGTEEAIAAFSKIGQAFRDDVVSGVMGGVFSMEKVWGNFTQNLYKMILEKTFNPVGAGMGSLANSLMGIWDQTLGSLITPIFTFVGQAIAAFGVMFANFVLQTLGFKTFFQSVGTFLGTAWKAVTESMVGQWVGALIAMGASLIVTIGGAIGAFALLAASAAAAAVAMIPIVGPVLAVGAYAATFGLVIAGVAQLASLALGLAGGATQVIGGSSTDTIPAMLSPGEMVIPQGIADGIRSGDLSLGGPGGSGGVTEVVLSFKDGAIDFIEAQIIKRNRLGGSAIAAG